MHCLFWSISKQNSEKRKKKVVETVSLKARCQQDWFSVRVMNLFCVFLPVCGSFLPILGVLGLLKYHSDLYLHLCMMFSVCISTFKAFLLTRTQINYLRVQPNPPFSLLTSLKILSPNKACYTGCQGANTNKKKNEGDTIPSITVMNMRSSYQRC